MWSSISHFLYFLWKDNLILGKCFLSLYSLFFLYFIFKTNSGKAASNCFSVTLKITTSLSSLYDVHSELMLSLIVILLNASNP